MAIAVATYIININPFPGSKKFQNFYSSACHFALVLQLDKEGFPKQQILDSSKMKEFADNNFKFDGNGREFSKRVENTVGKGEIAHFEQFLLFPQRF